MSPLRLFCLLVSLTVAVRASDAPRLPDITIDGRLDDWAGGGLVIENLASMDGMPAPAGSLAVRVRLGWDEQGLLFATEIDDNVLTEAPVDLYTADSVELFVARAVGDKDRLQILFAPGLNPPQAGPRIVFEDHRKNKTLPPQVEAIRVATAAGYRIECRVPWRMLGWSPEGAVGIQVIVNDADHGPARLKWVWHPGEQSSTDSRQLNTVRLAETASPAERTFWRWNPVASGRLSVVVDSTGPSPPPLRWITAHENDRLIAQVALIPGSAGARSEFILPARGEDIALSLDDQSIGLIRLKSTEQFDTTKINRADYSLTPAVFSGATFPEARLAKPAEIEKLLGPVTIKARYFDANQQEVTAPSKPGRYGIVYEIGSRQGPPVVRYQTLFKLPADINWHTAQIAFNGIELPAEAGLGQPGMRRHTKDLSNLFNDSWRAHLSESPEAAMVLAAISEAGTSDGDNLATTRNGARRLNQDWWYRLRQKIGHWEQYDHVVHTPPGYDTDLEKRWPLVLFLHGSGDGENRQILQKWGPTRQIAQGRKFPFILVAPRSPAGPWQSWYAPQLGALLDDIESKYRVDKTRIYVTGLSMGGFGTWRLASEFPGRFAALAPFCGGWDENEASRVAAIPTWAFHGDQDKAVPVENTVRMIEAIRKAGGQPRMTIYPGVGHVCWEEAYGGQKLYEWLLAQKLTVPPANAAKP